MVFGKIRKRLKKDFGRAKEGVKSFLGISSRGQVGTRGSDLASSFGDVSPRATSRGQLLNIEGSKKLAELESLRGSFAGQDRTSIIEGGRESTFFGKELEDRAGFLKTGAEQRTKSGELTAIERKNFLQALKEQGIEGAGLGSSNELAQLLADQGLAQPEFQEGQTTSEDFFNQFRGSIDRILKFEGKLAATTGAVALGGALTVPSAATGATALSLGRAAKTIGGVGFLGGLYGINEFVLSPSELATWAAVDNVAGQAAFLTRDLPFAVRDGSITPAQAGELLAQSKKVIKDSEEFVVFTTSKNPKLMPNSKILRSAIDEAKRRTEFTELQLTELQGGNQ